MRFAATVPNNLNRMATIRSPERAYSNLHGACQNQLMEHVFDSHVEDKENLLKSELFSNKQNQEIFRRIFHADSFSDKIEDGRQTSAYYNKVRGMDMVLLSLKLICLALIVLQYELEYNESFNDESEILLWGIFFTTLFIVPGIFIRYHVYILFQKKRYKIHSNDNIYTLGYLKYLILDLAITCIIPLPFTKGIKFEYFVEWEQGSIEYHVNEILSLFSSLKIILIIKEVLSSSKWSSSRARRVCDMYGCESNYLFVLRSLMSEYTLLILGVAGVSSLFVFAFCIRVSENPLLKLNPELVISNNFGTYWNALWCIILTITTVGYGDTFPKTSFGRLVNFCAAIWGVLLLSLAVLGITRLLNLTPMEDSAVQILRRLEIKGNIKHVSTKLFTNLALAMIRYKNNNKKKEKHLHKVKKYLKKIKLLRRLPLKTPTQSLKLIFSNKKRQYKAMLNSSLKFEEFDKKIEKINEGISSISETQLILCKGMNEIIDKLRKRKNQHFIKALDNERNLDSDKRTTKNLKTQSQGEFSDFSISGFKSLNINE